MFSSMFLCSCCHKRCILMSFFWQCTIPYLQIPHIIHHHTTSMYANLKPAMTAMCSSSTCLFRAQESANESKLFWTSLFFLHSTVQLCAGRAGGSSNWGWGWQIFSSNIELPKVDSFFYVDLFSSGAQVKGVPTFFSSQYATIGYNWKGQHFNLWQPEAHPVCFLPQSLRLCLGLRRQPLSPQVLRPVLTVLVSKSVTRAFSIVYIILYYTFQTCTQLAKASWKWPISTVNRCQMSWDVIGCQRSLRCRTAHLKLA